MRNSIFVQSFTRNLNSINYVSSEMIFMSVIGKNISIKLKLQFVIKDNDKFYVNYLF